MTFYIDDFFYGTEIDFDTDEEVSSYIFDDIRIKKFEKHFVQTIVNHTNYEYKEHLLEMIEPVIEFIRYGRSSDYSVDILDTTGIEFCINDDFFDRLKDEYVLSDSIDFDKYDDYEDNIKEIPLNKYTLTDYSTLFVNLDSHSFAEINLWHEIYHEVNSNILVNSQKDNQRILENSYELIIREVSKISNSDDVVSFLEAEKYRTHMIFDNSKKRQYQLKSNNHYMSFLYKCKICKPEGENKDIYFEFTNALIDGYTHYLFLSNISRTEINEYKKDLEVLKRYEGNERHIKLLSKKIEICSIPKTCHKLMIFKPLSIVLNIETSKITSYIKSATDFDVSKATMNKYFETLTPLELKPKIFKDFQSKLQSFF